MRTLLALPVLLCVIAASAAPAAEFDLDSGRVVLRQLQYCVDCGSALLVTHVRAGVPVRCPDCGKEQPRLAPEYLLTQMYQLCKVCQSPLAPDSHRPGEVVECPTCHARQPLSADVFRRGEQADGLGYVPGFPPGTGKKKLLYSPNRPDAAITMIPLDGAGSLSDLPLPPEFAQQAGQAAQKIPAPPEELLPAVLPDKYAEVRELTPSFSTEPNRGAVDVPSVTAESFGAKRPAQMPPETVVSSGAVVARVNGEPIYDREVRRIVDPVVRRMREQAAQSGASGASGAEAVAAIAAREKALRREVLERLVDRELALREAAAIGYKPDPEAVRNRENELAQILAGTGLDIRREAIRDVTMADMRKRYGEKPGAATPSAVREFYARHKNGLMRPRAVALDQLVVFEDRLDKPDARNARDIALEISGLLESGEKFDALRERYDEFAAGAGVRVEPRLLPVGAYARQVVAAGGELRQGAVFGPLFMEGMALFCKVTENRPESPVPFDEVEGEIRRRLELEASEENLTAWLSRLRGRARIEIAE